MTSRAEYITNPLLRVYGGRSPQIQRLLGTRPRSGGGIFFTFDSASFARASEAAHADPREAWAFAAQGADAWKGSNEGRVFADGCALIEEARTNYVVQSRELFAGGSPWLPSAGLTTPGAADGPDGASGTADAQECPSGAVYAYQGITVTAGDTLAGSAYLRSVSGAVLAHQAAISGSATVGAMLADASGSRDLSETFARYSAVLTLDPADATVSYIVCEGRAQPYGTSTKALECIHDLGQLEVGSFATSPIRTAGTAAARLGDVVTHTIQAAEVAPGRRGFRVSVWPLFASSAETGADLTVFCVGAELFHLYRSGTSGDTWILAGKSGAVCTVAGVDWEALEKLTFTVMAPDADTWELTVLNEETGQEASATNALGSDTTHAAWEGETLYVGSDNGADIFSAVYAPFRRYSS